MQTARAVETGPGHDPSRARRCRDTSRNVLERPWRHRRRCRFARAADSPAHRPRVARTSRERLDDLVPTRQGERGRRGAPWRAGPDGWSSATSYGELVREPDAEEHAVARAGQPETDRAFHAGMVR